MDETRLPTYLPTDVVGARAARPLRGRAARALLAASSLLAVAVVSLGLALLLTPAQEVAALGQRIEVGTTDPSLSLSGPGELVLFGRSMPTRIDFPGPVRPRLVLTDITIDRQVATAFLRDRSVSEAAGMLGARLAAGLRRWVVVELAVLTAVALVLLGAVAGWRRHGWRETVATIGAGLLLAHGLNAGALAVAAATAPERLASIETLHELVGADPVRSVRPVAGPPLDDVRAVVLGDSTAAGLGGPPLRGATADDSACRRSGFAFAETLGRVNGWEVRNLACSGATIRWGILGRQRAHGRWLPPQLAVAEGATDLERVIVNVGANDVGWGVLMGACALADRCDDRAQTAYFQRRLDRFARDAYALFRRLAALRGDPEVIVSEYYAPFSPEGSKCLGAIGLDPEKVRVLLTRLDALNAVLAEGADTFGFRTVRPDFDGHGVCAQLPYVQGLDAAAPFHPNALGQLAIALAFGSVR